MCSFEIDDLNLVATELRLGIPGTDHQGKKKKRTLNTEEEEEEEGSAASPKAQIVGWPPVRSYRKNTTTFLQTRKLAAESEAASSSACVCGMYVKVSMDGAPYLRKIHLKSYNGYPELLKALENLFTFSIGEYSGREGYKRSEHAPTYEDKDGDWMLVGDVPWEMFITSCKKLRIMKGREARGLGSTDL